IEKAAGTASEDRDSDIGRVAQAGGLATEENGDSPILQTGGETAEATPKKSFWSFLTPKPKKPAVKDPFADSPELKSTAKSEDPTASPGKARLASSSVAVPESGTPEKEPYAPEKWFEKELANQPAPSWA